MIIDLTDHDLDIEGRQCRFVAEYKFHPERKWRADFAEVRHRILIELQGGIWMKGGQGAHNGAGHIRDMEKINAAQSLGWTVFQYPKMDARYQGQLITDIEALFRHQDKIARFGNGNGGTFVDTYNRPMVNRHSEHLYHDAATIDKHAREGRTDKGIGASTSYINWGNAKKSKRGTK